MRYVLYVLLAVNLLGACTTLLDKWRAKRGSRRIRERTLLLYCLCGACPGVYLTMRAIRHKTLHRRFMWGIPAIFVLQLALCAAVYWFLVEGRSL